MTDTTCHALLRKCRDQFAFYASNHRAKPGGTDPESDTGQKAEANEQFVREIDDFLSARNLPDNLAKIEPSVELPAVDKTLRAVDIVKGMKLPPLVEMSLRKGADHMAQVIAFHDTYRVETAVLGSEDPRFEHMTNDRVAMRVGLIAEEFLELLADGFGIRAEIVLHASGGVGYLDMSNKSLAAQMGLSAGKRNGAEVADALGDIVYVCYGFALELGYDLRDVITEIHASNMTKLGADGEPIMRVDGKVLKGPNYVPPNIPVTLGLVAEAS